MSSDLSDYSILGLKPRMSVQEALLRLGIPSQDNTLGQTREIVWINEDGAVSVRAWADGIFSISGSQIEINGSPVADTGEPLSEVQHHLPPPEESSDTFTTYLGGSVKIHHTDGFAMTFSITILPDCR